MSDALEPPSPFTARPRSEQPLERRMRVNGIELCVFEWPGEGAPVLLVHATGFHGRTWDAVARQLPEHRVIAVDMRGHGRSDRPEEPYSWDRFGDDVTALVRALDLRAVIGVGHSMGGHSIVQAAAHEVDRFAALVLVDPVIRRPSGESMDRFQFVAKRRNQWASPAEMVERFRDRAPYSTWLPEVLEDYATYGLLPSGEHDEYELACPPVVEASIYGRSGDTDVYALLPRITAPVRVLRARQTEPGVEAAPFSVSPTDPELASAFPHAEDVLLADRSHFIPMEAPEVVARHIREMAERATS